MGLLKTLINFVKDSHKKDMETLNNITQPNKWFETTNVSGKEKLIQQMEDGLFIPLELLKPMGIKEDHPAYIKMKKRYEERDNERKETLITKFGAEIAEKILSKSVWEGMTVEMLIESQGEWEEKSESFSKGVSKVKYFYDYSENRLGNASYDYEVSAEDGIVVGWKDRRTRGTKSSS